MAENDVSIVLIGMPGAGKSTVGVMLAKLTCRSFVDTDVLIQSSQGRPLQDIVDREGHLALRAIEEQVILQFDCRNCVIATGGSAVYSPAAMAHLKRHGIVVFLDAELPVLEARVRDLDTRGLAKRPDQSFRQLFEERVPLYAKYADVTIACGRLTHDEVCARIIGELKEGHRRAVCA
ncbi:MAG: shikimate kinase [Nitrospirota bacterium]